MIDLSKKYQTRDGRPVRIYATDGRGKFPVHGAIKATAGWTSANWRLDGVYDMPGEDDPMDLVPAPARRYLTLVEAAERFGVDLRVSEWGFSNLDHANYVAHVDAGSSAPYDAPEHLTVEIQPENAEAEG